MTVAPAPVVSPDTPLAPLAPPEPPVDPAVLEKIVAVPPPTLRPDELARWQREIVRVEEARDGEGGLRVPSEMRHYDDTRRFLAVQMADARAHELKLPEDLGDLAAMYERGEVVDLPPIGEHHVLYDVGMDANEPPPTAPAARRLAAKWGLDLADTDDRKAFQVRLLSTLRPEARDQALEIARAYHERFGRLLPLSSLIRTVAYQKRLTRVNSNATKVVAPPHTTGMAFDISYRFMAHDEQTFVMERVAEMEQAGRAEALRERRGCIHVYTLAGGRPSENLVAQSLSAVDDARAAD